MESETNSPDASVDRVVRRLNGEVMKTSKAIEVNIGGLFFLGDIEFKRIRFEQQATVLFRCADNIAAVSQADESVWFIPVGKAVQLKSAVFRVEQERQAMSTDANETSEQPFVTCACGSTLFIRSLRVSGWWKEVITGDGEVDETDLDSLKYGPQPKTVKCAECGKVNPNPSYR